ncbi:dihydroorotate dehydrogenase electron transfer subunit [Candidatus Omnitrophota bacterium]
MHSTQIDSKIISNSKIARSYYLLSLEVPYLFKDAQPGQFVHIRINDSCDPLLRRPLSIHRLISVKSKSSKQKLHLNILYEVKGKGTKLLSEKREGECLNILGPLGRGFDLQSKDIRNQINIIIAGGAGIAPLYFLADKIVPLKSKQSKQDSALVFIGASTGVKILGEKEFKNLGCQVSIATDDGTRGYKGRVVKLFEKTLSKIENKLRKSSKPRSINVYACGPQAMLTELSKICIIKKIPLQVSLEEFMGCGVGACLGCAIETKTGYKRVCHDGPVFDAHDISWKY